jgi:hypothetical protein
MRTIQYFWMRAMFSTRKGKFYYRPWKQLIMIILLNTYCLVLTGRSLDVLT